MSKKMLTYEEAVSLPPEGDSVHTFINMGFGLCGADWSREEILDKLRKSEIIELTGQMARGMNHGLCAYGKNAKRQSDILFIETDAAKLAEFDPEGEEGADNERET